MKESASPAGVTTKPQFDNYYRWVEPDSDITVCLNLETVNRLQLDVLGGVGAFSHTGNEVGGILLGRTESDEGRTLIFVDDIVPVPCEHRHGPFYALTAKDVVTFEAALARRRPLVVGYYRSHNRDGLFLSADDLHLIRRYFRGTNNLFLLIKTLLSRACTAGFFFWKDGQIQAEFTDSEAPLIPIAVSYSDESPSPGETVHDITAVAPALVLPPADPVRSRALQLRLMRGMAIAGAAAAVTFAVVRYRERSVPEPVHGRDGIAIPVVPQDTGPRAQTSVRAPAPIVKRAVPQVTGQPPGPAEAVLPHAQDNASDTLHAQPTIPAPSPASLPTETAAVPSPGPAQPGPAPSPNAETASSERSPNAAPAGPPETPIARPALVTPPSLAENPATPSIEGQRTDTGTRDAPPVPTPAPSTPATSPAAHTFIGPQVIHQVTPAVPRGVGPMITTDVQVDVVVAIDAKGKVTGARIASTRGAAAGLLTIEALKAAQLFRFQPAKENSRNVTSSMVLTFRFARTAR